MPFWRSILYISGLLPLIFLIIECTKFLVDSSSGLRFISQHLIVWHFWITLLWYILHMHLLDHLNYPLSIFGWDAGGLKIIKINIVMVIIITFCYLNCYESVGSDYMMVKIDVFLSCDWLDVYGVCILIQVTVIHGFWTVSIGGSFNSRFISCDWALRRATLTG